MKYYKEILSMIGFTALAITLFCYGYRNVNELKLVQKGNNEPDPTNIRRYTWEPKSNSWTMQSRPIVAGKEGDVFLDMKLTAAKTSSK